MGRLYWVLFGQGFTGGKAFSRKTLYSDMVKATTQKKNRATDLLVWGMETQSYMFRFYSSAAKWKVPG
jgi:hypothetical protein